jgi:hydrogenase maturation protease
VTGHRLVIGVGNPARGDDGAGRVVACRLRSRNGCACVVRESSGEATALMDAWTGFDDVSIVDACLGAGEPGTIVRLERDQLDRLASLQARRCASTHGFGLAQGLALARALGRLPSRLVIYAIEGGDFQDGERLSPAVDRAVSELVALLVQ